MARRRGFDLRDATQLQPFLLPNVRLRGRTISGGSYGTVEELDVQGLLCAGKKLYSIFFERETDQASDATRILERFVQECSLLADLRHPHIVLFIGICFLDGSDLPVLVTEYLPYCLDSLLEGDDRVDLPLAMKISILRDVALGLNHMHTRTPPVIHRDLTAKTVLLSSAMTGKIADFGVARILNLRPGQQEAYMTQCPGTLVYMPPEVLEQNPKYNSTIDIFSFGHLTLFTIVQDFPYPTPAVVMDPNNPGMLVCRTEVQRRSQQMEQLSHQLGGERHPLVQMVTRCLHNDPRQRPSARHVLSQLEEMRTNIEDHYEHMSKLELIQALRRREGGEGEGALQAQVTQLQGQLQAQAVELEASRAETQRQVQQIQASLQERVRVAEQRARNAEDQLKRQVAKLLSRQQQQGLQERVRVAEQRARDAEGRLERQVAELQQELSRQRDLHRQQEQQLVLLQERAREAERRASTAEDRLQMARPPSTRDDGEPWLLRKDDIELTARELGRGGWATVRVAKLQVAAKCLHTLIASNYNRRLFAREMNVAARVRHPNLVLFLGASLEGEPTILMEKMTTSLRAVLERRPFKPPQITSISLDVARALDYLHEMQPDPIIHRDISSANVLLNPGPNHTWVAKVSDYGSANLVRQLATANPGSPVYAAPEAEYPSRQSPKMDVYSYGVLLLEMCTCQFPDPDERDKLVPTAEHPQVAPLIPQCLQREPRGRPSMGAIVNHLEH